jgi:hypothetical protein
MKTEPSTELKQEELKQEPVTEIKVAWKNTWKAGVEAK